MEREKGIRAKRTEQVLKPFGNYAYTGDFLRGLVDSARLLLLAAQDERRPRGGENFLALHGPSAVLLAVTAFESFINDALWMCLRTLTVNEAAFQQLVKADTLTDKFRDIPHLVTGGPELVNEDVALMQQVRHEIVHFYPRPVGSTNVPEWLQPLAERGLLYSIGSAPKDIGWQQKLQSFQLARWCGQVTSVAAEQFAEALAAGEQGEDHLSMVAYNVRITAPYFRALVI